MKVGIEAMNAYCGRTFLDIKTLFEARNLDMMRFSNLMMQKKSVGLPCEDPVTNAVNAARPIIAQLSSAEKNRIEAVITASESGLDFGKSLSTYIHKYLELNRNCRLFEIKQACYGGTAALQTAANFIKAGGVSPGGKVLVIATDVARAAAKMTYAEPSQGVTAVAMLISENPDIMELEFGCNGYYGYEVFDTCRPEPHIETGDPDLSLLSYLDCLEQSFKLYCEKVSGSDFRNSFKYLAFHTPFGGMVKGGHRTMMRKFCKAPIDEVNLDFEKRVVPSLKYCVEVGNVYSATVYLALCGLIDSASIESATRIGLFSYGSGCSSEFYSGIVTPLSKEKLGKMQIAAALRDRHSLTMPEYETILDLDMEWMFGTKNKKIDNAPYAGIYNRYMAGKGLLTLDEVKEYERKYIWS